MLFVSSSLVLKEDLEWRERTKPIFTNLVTDRRACELECIHVSLKSSF